jgi:hypothetical protein
MDSPNRPLRQPLNDEILKSITTPGHDEIVKMNQCRRRFLAPRVTTYSTLNSAVVCFPFVATASSPTEGTGKLNVNGIQQRNIGSLREVTFEPLAGSAS